MRLGRVTALAGSECWGLLGLLLATLMLAGCAGRRQAAVVVPRVSNGDRGESGTNLHVTTFDQVWRIIHETHYDTNFNGVDWPLVRERLRPEAAAAGSNEELRPVLERMLRGFGQSHMGIIPAPAVASVLASPVRDGKLGTGGQGFRGRAGTLGMEVRVLRDQVVVFRLGKDGPAERSGIRPGWVLRKVDGMGLEERLERLPDELDRRRRQFLAWRMVNDLLSGPVGTKAELEFSSGWGRVEKRQVERSEETGEWVKFGLLPGFHAQLESDEVGTGTGAKVGVIRFNIWMLPIAARFDDAIDRFRGADGLIIDLRGNMGGLAGMLTGISGHFFEERVSLGTMKMRDNELHFFANPRKVNSKGMRVAPYAGPVAILIDELSLSLAEVFAGGMQSVGRARVFGARSGGQTLPAIWDRLPNGDVLYHVVADFITPTGERLEGRGVDPDVSCRLKRRDLLKGRDAAMEAAIRWIERFPERRVIRR